MNMALVYKEEDIDKPKLSAALRSTERDRLIHVINEDFNIIVKYENFKEHKERIMTPRRAEVLPSGTISKIEKYALGGVDRYMIRLVIWGNLQFIARNIILRAPVAWTKLVRFMVMNAVGLDFTVDQLDVKGLLLHATLPGTNVVWDTLARVSRIPGAKKRVAQLSRSHHSLRKAPKLW